MSKRKYTQTESSSDGSGSVSSEEDSEDSEPAPKEIKRSSASQIRSRLKDRVKKDINCLPYGDMVLYLNIPATRQGNLVLLHSMMPARQLLAALKGIQKHHPCRDPRLDERIDEVKRAAVLMQGVRISDDEGSGEEAEADEEAPEDQAGVEEEEEGAAGGDDFDDGNEEEDQGAEEEHEDSTEQEERECVRAIRAAAQQVLKEADPDVTTGRMVRQQVAALTKLPADDPLLKSTVKAVIAAYDAEEQSAGAASGEVDAGEGLEADAGGDDACEEPGAGLGAAALAADEAAARAEADAAAAAAAATLSELAGNSTAAATDGLAAEAAQRPPRRAAAAGVAAATFADQDDDSPARVQRNKAQRKQAGQGAAGDKPQAKSKTQQDLLSAVNNGKRFMAIIDIIRKESSAPDKFKEARADAIFAAKLAEGHATSVAAAAKAVKLKNELELHATYMQ